MDKRTVKRLNITGGVAKNSKRCDACKNLIYADNWYKHIRVSYVTGRDSYHHIHDTRICEEKLKVSLGMCEPNFYSTRPV